MFIYDDFGWVQTGRKFAGIVPLVVNLVKIKVVGSGDIKKSGVRRHVIAVKTISMNIRSVVSKAMSIDAEVEGCHAWKQRIWTIVSGLPKTLGKVMSRVKS